MHTCTFYEPTNKYNTRNINQINLLNTIREQWHLNLTSNRLVKFLYAVCFLGLYRNRKNKWNLLME